MGPKIASAGTIVRFELAILLGIHFALLVNFWLNWFFVLTPPEPDGKSSSDAKFDRKAFDVHPEKFPFVSVLVPARNEAVNLPRFIRSFQQQTYPRAELIVYDDESDDSTWEIISAASSADSHMKAIQGVKLPNGWVGKVFACHNLASVASGDILLFLDADTEFLHPNALQKLVHYNDVCGTGTVVTGIPGIRGGGLLIVSMVGHFILSLVPWWLQKKKLFALFAGVNGQCWMIDTGLYRTFKPHDAVRDQVLEDIMIGRYLNSKGVPQVLVDMQNDLAVYMYDDIFAAWRGFRKNASSMLGKNSTVALATWSLYVLFYIVAPIFFPVLILTHIVLKLSTDRAIGQPLWISVLAPVSILLTSILGIDSIVTRSRNRIVWKGRSI